MSAHAGRRIHKSYKKTMLCGLMLFVLLWISFFVYAVVWKPQWLLEGRAVPTRQPFSWQVAEAKNSQRIHVTLNEISAAGYDIVLPVSQVHMAAMLKYPTDMKFMDKVLVLTPVHNAADHLEHFSEILMTLTYPRPLLSLALGEDSSTDETMPAAVAIHEKLSQRFRRVSIIRLNLSGQLHGNVRTKHDEGVQYSRRTHLARARNMLLKSALSDEKWVLWIDSDVKVIPSNLVEQLLSAEKDVVVPLCVRNDPYHHIKKVYDKNTWRETETSLRQQRESPADKLFLEGYGPSNRIYLNSLRPEGRVVPLDGVGACSLLVRADCHREGLIFPDFIYDHHVETEGLAKMARDKGYGVFGMPFVEVVHV
ncbi:uncharacterized protein LOC135477034 [Liolophura sinensis]|uniref:uncharacterized protein LOC135477034 n=1 Tax=Liolophura sinensis TaxID=3198878 RepID=UPI0031596144